MVSRPRVMTIVGPIPTRPPASTRKRTRIVQILVPDALDNFEEVFS